jgi:pyridoxamine 5'-phosphate oxidase
MAMTHPTLIPPTPSEADYAASPAIEADEAALFAQDEPFALFAEWLEAAKAGEPNDPNAMALATADETGLPDVRMVLLKGVDGGGFVFYSNLESAKGRQIAGNPQAALCFHWKSLRRQVRVRGPLALVSAAEADAYFQSRARDSRLGAWASEQSRPMEGRFALERRIADAGLRYGLGPVPRPPHWSGWRLTPLSIEFWRDRPFRLHDRLRFTRAHAPGDWTRERLYP